jgi:hypothetical protein
MLSVRFVKGGLKNQEEIMALGLYVPASQLLEKTTKSLGVEYLDMGKIICDEEGKSCDVVDVDLNVLIYDHGHWSVSGQKYYGEKLMASECFRNVVGLGL